MSPSEPSDSGSLAAAREEAIEQLSTAFAHGEIGLDDFEQRVDAAYAATDDERLRSLMHGLEGAAATTALVRVETGETRHRRELVPAPPPGAQIVAARRPADALAVFGNLQRSGTWRLEDGTRAVAVFANVELDLRDVVLAPGITHLACRAVFGNIEITVPPDLAIECVGAGVLGSFSSVHRVPSEGASERAVLRIEGAAVFGNVEVHTLPRGMEPPQGPAREPAHHRLPGGR
jgi:hypothetical protein